MLKTATSVPVHNVTATRATRLRLSKSSMRAKSRCGPLFMILWMELCSSGRRHRLLRRQRGDVLGFSAAATPDRGRGGVEV